MLIKAITASVLAISAIAAAPSHETTDALSPELAPLADIPELAWHVAPAVAAACTVSCYNNHVGLHYTENGSDSQVGEGPHATPMAGFCAETPPLLRVFRSYRDDSAGNRFRGRRHTPRNDH